MILSAVHICYDPSHHPFSSDGAIKIEHLDSRSSASKIIRAVIRYNEIDATIWESYSLHRCYCNSHTKTEDQRLEAVKSELTLDQLEIRDGDSIFIRKLDDRLDEMEKEQGSPSRRSSRKRKERADEIPDSTCRKRESTSNSSNARATIDKVSSNLENLTSDAASAARTISKLLGGDGWKTQPIGKLGPIQTRGENQLRMLSRLVKTSLEIEQNSEPEPGFLDSDLVEALTRAYHQRVSSSIAKQGESHFFHLGLSDYQQANELLKGKIEGNGSWERSKLNHLDESAFSRSAVRFPLSDSGLSGQPLNTARAVCALWNNDKWINQAPFPGLSPINLKQNSRNAILRQIAYLTRVKPGEATPDGFPSTVLRALQEAIKQRESSASSVSKFGWSQSKDMPRALEILLQNLKEEQMAHSTFTDYRPSKKMRIESLLNPQLL